ncbi:MAG: hypothetical protein IT209_12395 [Armatimonadetes bacterium]|nr:hypothetical protein [Armatimonadota bacterium]
MGDSNSVCKKKQASVTSWELDEAADSGAGAGLSCFPGLSEILVTPDYQKARMLEMRLRVCGIPCIINSSAASGVFGEYEEFFGQTSVLVPNNMVTDANRVLRQETILN